MQFLLGFAAGLAVGLSALLFRKKPEMLGTLQIVIPSLDPDDGPYMFMELNTGVGDLSKYEYGLFRINFESYGTQKTHSV